MYVLYNTNMGYAWTKLNIKLLQYNGKYLDKLCVYNYPVEKPKSDNNNIRI